MIATRARSGSRAASYDRPGTSSSRAALEDRVWGSVIRGQDTGARIAWPVRTVGTEVDPGASPRCRSRGSSAQGRAGRHLRETASSPYG